MNLNLVDFLKYSNILSSLHSFEKVNQSPSKAGFTLSLVAQ